MTDYPAKPIPVALPEAPKPEDESSLGKLRFDGMKISRHIVIAVLWLTMGNISARHALKNAPDTRPEKIVERPILYTVTTQCNAPPKVERENPITKRGECIANCPGLPRIAPGDTPRPAFKSSFSWVPESL